MTTLAENVARVYEQGDFNDVPMVADDIIYEGAAVGEDGNGYAQPLTAGDPFLGFADVMADNSGGAAGAENVRVRQFGLVQLAIGSLAITDIGKPVYASDDDTFTLTASTNSHVGRVVRFVSSGVGIVAFDARRGGVGLLTPLTDNSDGTASDTLAAIDDALTGVDGAGSNAAPLAGVNTQLGILANAVASLAAKVNAILAQSK